MSNSIGNVNPSPPIGTALPQGVSARELLRQVTLEIQAEEQAAREAQQQRDAEVGAKRRAEVDALLARWQQHLDSYELLRETMNGLVEEMIETGEALASMRQPNPFNDSADAMSINIPALRVREPYRNRAFSTAEAMIEQRRAERAKLGRSR